MQFENFPQDIAMLEMFSSLYRLRNSESCYENNNNAYYTEPDLFAEIKTLAVGIVAEKEEGEEAENSVETAVECMWEESDSETDNK